MSKVQTRSGLECFLEKPSAWTDARRVGLIGNATSLSSDFQHTADLLHAHRELDLVRLFGPEHGIRSTAQYMQRANEPPVDEKTGVPIVSLYGNTFADLSPTTATMADLHAVIFDIQDVGARYYTYAATMALTMRVAAKVGIEVIVLDRPNPIGGIQVEGGGLEEGLENFCGLYPIPQRHGLSVAELAQLYNNAFGIGCRLTAVPCRDWGRHLYFDEIELPWVMPSPNMPYLTTALVYPGMCLLEGTNISEGRGTTRPFEIFGAPFVEPERLIGELHGCELPGVRFRPCDFVPTFEKYSDQICSGLQIHITDREQFLPYRTGLAAIWALKRLWPEQFAWRTTPYEFRDDVPAIDLLTGRPSVRIMIDEGQDFGRVYDRALDGAEKYWENRDAAILYE